MKRSVRDLAPARSSAAAVALALAASACGNGGSGSGGGGGGGGGGDQTAPLAIVQFPPDGSLTDAPDVRIVVAAQDDTGVTSVRAAGLSAALDSDGLWKVTLPLQEGSNTVRIETRDPRDNVDPDADTLPIRRERALWIDPGAVVLDSNRNEALVLDRGQRALFGVSIATGVRTLRSGPGVGNGPLFQDPRDVDFVASLDSAVVTDGDAVLLVSASTGQRSVLSSPGVGGGPSPVDLQGIALDSLNRLVVVDRGRAELLFVDPVSGQRVTASSDTIGTGPSLAGARAVAAGIAQAFVLVEPTRSILAVNLSSGDRTVLSGGGAGSGPDLVQPADLVVHPFDVLFVADEGAGAILSVDRVTGARQIFSSQQVGSGPAWVGPAGVTLDSDVDLLAVDRSRDTLFEVETTSSAGDRRLVSAFVQGTGPQLSRPVALSAGLVFPDRLVVADRTELIIAGVGNGARSLLSGSTRGGGAPFVELADVEVFPAPCIFIAALDAGLPGLVQVDHLTGDRNLLSGSTIGAGPSFSAPRSVALVSSASECPLFALVVDEPFAAPPAILRVDLTTGERTVLSDATHGTGPMLLAPVSIVMGAGEALVLDGTWDILSIDLTTGDRGVAFDAPGGLVGTPTDLHFDLGANLALVAAVAPPSLVFVNLTNQQTRVVSSTSTGTGPGLGRPVGVELLPSPTLGVIPSTPLAFVLDSARGSILAVDTRTGNRVIRSK